ncbi:MAG: HVA22/TB2/DP1 family protein, partial [Promethearchaeia archaeon]
MHSLLMVFAGIKSFRAIQSIDPEDDKQWLTFWLLFSIFEVLCFVTDFVLWAIPSYNGLKCAVLIFLGVFRGA